MAFVLEVTWEGCMYMMVMSGGRSSFDVDYTFKTVGRNFRGKPILWSLKQLWL